MTAEHEIGTAGGLLGDGTYGDRAYCKPCSEAARDWVDSDCPVRGDEIRRLNRFPAPQRETEVRWVVETTKPWLYGPFRFDNETEARTYLHAHEHQRNARLVREVVTREVIEEVPGE